MSNLDKAYETQINNIQKKTGKNMAELEALIAASGLTRHSDLRAMLMRDLGLGHGDANALVHHVLKSDGQRAAEAQGLSGDAVLDEIYSGAKAGLRPIHERLMAEISAFGEFESVPKKGYVSLRRKKQFAMIGPATNTRVEVGINHKSLPSDPRLLEQPAGGMCQYKVRLSDSGEIDDALIDWLRQSYQAAG